MYGYVRPVKGELKVSEYEQFQAAYCGLCHELGRRYGLACRFLVNFDFTFLAMLLADGPSVPTCRKRCIAHPIRRRTCACGGGSLETAADQTVILAYWKLRDGIRDGGFFPSLACRAACLAIGRAYKKASARRPAFAKAVREDLEELDRLEAEKCPSVDAAADRFAAILRAVSEDIEDVGRARAVGELCYHLGRIVYILDAADDLAEDAAADRYNPLRYRFETADGKLKPEDEKTLRTSLQHSHNAICAAYALLGENPYGGVLSNTIYMGLPSVAQAVFAGTWRAGNRLQRERSGI